MMTVFRKKMGETFSERKESQLTIRAMAKIYQQKHVVRQIRDGYLKCKVEKKKVKRWLFRLSLENLNLTPNLEDHFVKCSTHLKRIICYRGYWNPNHGQCFCLLYNTLSRLDQGVTCLWGWYILDRYTFFQKVHSMCEFVHTSIHVCICFKVFRCGI